MLYCRAHQREALNQGSILTKYVCMYVRAYVGGGSRSGMLRGMSLHTIGIYAKIQAICASHSLIRSDSSTQIDRGRRHSLAMEVGDDGAAGPLRLGYYKQQTASTANVTRATRASAYMTHTYSLHTGARQRCACVFLVMFVKVVVLEHSLICTFFNKE